MPAALSRGPARLLGWVVALGVFLVYLITAAPGAWWGDGQELACAAWTLGIAHPPGYPLYTILGHGVMKAMFWMDPGRALTLFSAACLAGAVGILISLFRRIIENDLIPHSKNSHTFENPQSNVASGRSDLLTNNPQSAILPACGAGLLVAFASTVWEHGTFAEVLPLTFLFGAGVLALAWAPAGTRPGVGRAAAIGGLFGLGMLNHYSLLALGPLAGLCVLRWAFDKRPRTNAECGMRNAEFNVRAEARTPNIADSNVASGRSDLLTPLLAAGCFLVMLLGYLYLPWRARMNPALNWGDPATLGRLKWMLTGGQFKDIFMGETNAGNGIERWLHWWGSLWLPENWCEPRGGVYPLAPTLLGAVLVCAALAGLARLALARWELGVGLMFVLLATFCYAIGYHIADIDGYFMIGLPAATVGWIVAAGVLVRRLQLSQAARGLARALPATLALAALLGNYYAIDKAWDDGPAAYGEGMLKLLPENALVVTSQGGRGDAEIYSLWYQQMVLGKRPDVTVFGSGFLFQGWYGRYFERPERPKIPIFTEDRPLSKSNQLIYNVKLFHGMLLPNLAAGRRVFTTMAYPDNAFLTEYLDPKPVAQVISQKYMDACAFPYLPMPIVYELHANAQLAKMDEAQLEGEFNKFVRRKTGR